MSEDLPLLRGPKSDDPEVGESTSFELGTPLRPSSSSFDLEPRPMETGLRALLKDPAFLATLKRGVIVLLLLIMLGSTILTVVPNGHTEQIEDGVLHGVTSRRPYEHPLEMQPRERVEVHVTTQLSGDGYYILVHMDQQPGCSSQWQQIGEVTRVNLSSVVEVQSFIEFDLNTYTDLMTNSCLRCYVTTNSPYPLAFSFEAKQYGLLVRFEVIFAAVILIGVYILITFDLVHRTVAAAIGAFFSLGVLALVRERPALEEVVSWIDEETIGLLFGMMIIVEIFSKTGFFEFAAVKAFKLSKGHIRRLVIALCILTALLSCVLDNVTTMLLIGPVTLQLANVLQLDPVPMLLGEVLFSNLGGTATLIGDPPNIIIGAALRYGFLDFLMNLTPICLLMMPLMALFLGFYYRKEWNVVCEIDVEELESKYGIKDYALLVQSSMVLLVVITLFFLEPILHLEQAWISLLGATVLMLVARPHGVEEVLHKVEWSTLIFFGCLFIMLEGLSELGLVAFIGSTVASLIQMADAEYQLIVALVLILWVSAIISAFIDNIPYTVTMIAVIEQLATKTGLPIRPLAFALSLGACLGGNGTIIGASANVVTVGIAEQAGHPISFGQFFKIGFPFMLITVVVANIYVLVVYGVIGWSGE